MEEKMDCMDGLKLGDAIEKVLMESGLSISAFSRKVGYSRQYIYELLKTHGEGSAHKVQLNTLKTICDATGYSLARLLADIGYIPKPKNETLPNTIIVVNRKGEKNVYTLNEENASLVEKVVKSLSSSVSFHI